MRVLIPVALLLCVVAYNLGYSHAERDAARATVEQVVGGVDAKDANLRSVRDAETIYIEGVVDDKVDTDNLLQRILRVSDGLREDAAVASLPDSDLAARVRDVEASNARLRRALRVALDGNREDTRRANEIARQLNLCISQMEADRQQRPHP